MEPEIITIPTVGIAHFLAATRTGSSLFPTVSSKTKFAVITANNSPEWKGVEYIYNEYFDDVDYELLESIKGSNNEKLKKLVPFDKDFGNGIALFLNEVYYKCDVIVCQCDAGVSRSVGLAVAISDFFCNNYRPTHQLYNKMVRDILVDSLMVNSKVPPKGSALYDEVLRNGCHRNSDCDHWYPWDCDYCPCLIDSMYKE